MWFLDICCEFFDQAIPTYPSIAWECIVKITMLESHREIMHTSKFTERCETILSHLSIHLQRINIRLTEDPFDESLSIYLQYILMAAPHLIKATCTIPRGFFTALCSVITWLIENEIKERQQRHLRPKTGVSRAANVQAEERETLFVGLIVRGLLTFQALTQRPTLSVDSGPILSHRSILVELLTLPMLHPHVAHQLNMLLQPVVEAMNQGPSRTYPFKNETC